MNRHLFLALAALALAGCGDARGERTLTGAGIGATAGAVIGAVTGMGLVTGTIAGAAVGGITGMMTDKSDVDLGDPAWKQGDGAQAAPANQNQAAPAQTAPAAQPQQQAPAAQPQQQAPAAQPQQQAPAAQPQQQAPAAQPQQQAPAAQPQQQAPAAQPQQQANAAADAETVRSIQTGLAKLGFDPGPADGVATEKTRAAIREFQQQNGLPANGEPSPDVAQKVAQQVASRGN